ncbi:aos protein [Capsaspora owczarzaki ATCC 30864]|uniref:aos protein n=1 Tax=Capsaspora owczarzaki (strain ATCC 30864) TaxID=595528 RepID=UPI0003526D81|nr:aos protein [Capsaspora owczarzaki ATCC 30864]|eukprot:XP_004346370.2 aos protein [Capsaspora owczarzaki ATCC 30864]
MAVAFTDDEAQLYDRQIRLWGLDAQKRMRSARVLLAGLTGLGVEVAKNIVLAGIKSITLLDGAVTTDADLTAQFYLGVESLGLNRLLVHNAFMVAVVVDEENLESKQDSFFSQFDIVCLVGAPLNTMISVNDACRKYCVKFIAGSVYGLSGFLFQDLLEHDYVEDVVRAPGEPPQVGKHETAQQALDAANETTASQFHSSFTPLSAALSVAWSDAIAAKRIKPAPKLWFALLALWQTQRQNIELQATSDLLASAGIPSSVLPLDYLSAFFQSIGPEMSPVSAIVGGVYAQEVLKAVSGKDAPLNNVFLFDGTDGAGYATRVSL